jgi:hypothetical protein
MEKAKKISILHLITTLDVGGAGKMHAYWISVNCGEAYDMFTCNGVLFHHESPCQGEGQQ